MSQLKIRELLSRSVTAIKNKLKIDSFTWEDYESKLNEAMQGESNLNFATAEITTGSSDTELIEFSELLGEPKIAIIQMQKTDFTQTNGKRYIIDILLNSDKTLNVHSFRQPGSATMAHVYNIYETGDFNFTYNNGTFSCEHSASTTMYFCKNITYLLSYYY